MGRAVGGEETLVARRGVDVPTLEQAISQIGPTAGWVGQCYGIALKLAEMIPGSRACYGHYRGPVSSRCKVASFKASHRNFGFVQHGWVELPDGRIADPTRWVFEASKPYIHVTDQVQEEMPPELKVCICGHLGDEHDSGFMQPCAADGCDCEDFIVDPDEEMNRGIEYDEGGNVFREEHERPRPAYDSGANQIDLQPASEEGQALVAGLLGHAAPYTAAELMWLANLSINSLGAKAHEVYEALAVAGVAGFVPLDNRTRARHQAQT